MLEKIGNLFAEARQSDWICITTDSSIRQDGHAVMGRGIALEAKIKFPQLPIELGKLIKREGNQVYLFPSMGIITFPTKEDFYMKSSINLIENSCKALVNLVEGFPLRGNILIPRPGCGYGKLKWQQVRPILEKHLKTDQYVIFRL